MRALRRAPNRWASSDLISYWVPNYSEEIVEQSLVALHQEGKLKHDTVLCWDGKKDVYRLKQHEQNRSTGEDPECP